MENQAPGTTLYQRVAALLTARHETLACIDVGLGGQVSAALTAVPGSSAFYLGAYILTAERSAWPKTVASRALRQGERTHLQAQLCALATIAQEDFGAVWGLAIAGTSATGHVAKDSADSIPPATTVRHTNPASIGIALRSPSDTVTHAQTELPAAGAEPGTGGLVQYVLRQLAAGLAQEHEDPT